MPVNLNKPHLWKEDIAKSVDMYNDWFMKFAPKTFREERLKTTKAVEATLRETGGLTNVKPTILRRCPEVLPTLRMSACPPLAVDRLIGLAGVSSNLVKTMEEKQQLPPRMSADDAEAQLLKLTTIIEKMADPDIFVWLGRSSVATKPELRRAATIVADRLCGARTNPIIRNEQERRQLAQIRTWLEARGYRQLDSGIQFDAMPPCTFGFRINVPGKQEGGQGEGTVNLPMDAVIMPKTAKPGNLPLLFEAKSAGDYTNPNKRRKEEATKVAQLRRQHGSDIHFNLFLCGYFDSGYLGYEAAEGIDWVWEHRIDDLAQFGV